MKSLKQGFQFIWSNKIIKYLSLLFFGYNFVLQFFYANYIYYLKIDCHIPENQLSYYFIPAGLSAISGAIVAPYLINKFAKHKIIFCLNILTLFFFSFIALSNSSLLTVTFWSIITGLNSIIIVSFFTLRQYIVPDHLKSRVFVVSRMISYSAIPLGAIGSGYFLEIINNFKYLVLIGSIILFIFLLFIFLSEKKSKM